MSAALEDPAPGSAASLPSSPIARLAGVDLARCLAIFGMIAVNYRVVSDPDFSEVSPAWLDRIFDEIAGRAAALFVLIAGIGATLMSRRLTPAAAPVRPPILRRLALVAVLGACAVLASFHAWGATVEGELARARADGLPISTFARRAFEQGELRVWLFDLAFLVAAIGCALIALDARLGGARGRLVRRALLLFAVGYAWYPLWTGDILHYYGVFLLVGAALVAAPPVAVIATAAAALVAAAAWQWDQHFTQGWQVILLEDLSFWTWTGFWRNLVFNGWHPFCPWFALFAIGLLVGRADLARARVAWLLLGCGVLVAAGTLVAADLATDELRRREAQDVAAAFPVERVEPSDAVEHDGPVLDAQGAPVRPRRRVSMRIQSGLTSEHPAVVDDLKLLRSRLRDLRDDAVYPELRLELRRGEDGPIAAIQVAHDPGAPLPENAEEVFARTRDELVAWMAGRGSGLFEVTAQAMFGAAPWPRRLDVVAIERLSPVRALGAQGEDARRLDVTRRATVSSSRVDEAGKTPRRLLLQTGTGPWPNPNPFFVISAAAIGCALLGCCLLLARVRALRRPLEPFVRTGRMALTMYVAHVVLGLGALALIGKASGEDLRFIAFSVTVCWLAAVSGAHAWLAFFRLGPLEAALRWLTR